MTPEERLRELGYELPETPSSLGSYVPFVEAGGLIFISGILPLKQGSLIYTGKIGSEITLEQARECAVQVVLNCLSILKANLGDLNRIGRCIRLNGYLQTSDNFKDHPLVLNAASDLIVKVFGEEGRHTRIAIGVSSLPMDSPLEMDFIWSLRN